MQPHALPIFRDNYLWVIEKNHQVVAVDPGDAGPLLAWLAAHGHQLAAVLVTHRHADHIGGLADIAAHRLATQSGATQSGARQSGAPHNGATHNPVPVYGPAGIAGITHPLHEGDVLEIAALGLQFHVWATPGHTPEHLVYLGHGWLLCGDTLFAAGCGRLLDGTPAQMQTSLARLRDLPDETQVFCTHEYTLSNERFALAVEPENMALQARHARHIALRAQGLPTLPVRLGDEKAINPMLRWDVPAVQQAARQHGATDLKPLAVFAAIRRWKDEFTG